MNLVSRVISVHKVCFQHRILSNMRLYIILFSTIKIFVSYSMKFFYNTFLAHCDELLSLYSTISSTSANRFFNAYKEYNAIYKSHLCKYLDVTKILVYTAQACHSLVPPDVSNFSLFYFILLLAHNLEYFFFCYFLGYWINYSLIIQQLYLRTQFNRSNGCWVSFHLRK